MIDISISPVALAIGQFEVRWYGVFIALGIVALILWTLWQVKKGAKVGSDTVFNAAIVGIPSGIIISRLLHVVDEWSYYGQNLGQIIGASGLTAYGAVLGAALGIWVYSKFGHFRFAYFADVMAPGIILAQAIGRVGCTINGCCFGTETSLPWGIVYTHPLSLGPIGVSVQPTTVYEIIFNLLVFGILIKLKGRLKPDGSLFSIYLGAYAAWRLGSDFLRDGSPFLFGLHQAQVISIVVLLITIPFIIWRTRWVKPEPATIDVVGEPGAEV